MCGNKDCWNESRKNGLGMPGHEFPQDKGKVKVDTMEEINPCATAFMYKNLREAEDGERNSSDISKSKQNVIPIDIVRQKMESTIALA